MQKQNESYDNSVNVDKNSYNKAINDLVDELHKKAFPQNLFMSREGYMEKNNVVGLETVDRIAEQLKR